MRPKPVSDGFIFGIEKHHSRTTCTTRWRGEGDAAAAHSWVRARKYDGTRCTWHAKKDPTNKTLLHVLCCRGRIYRGLRLLYVLMFP